MFFAELVAQKNISGVIVNFLPSWWHGNYGIVWGERMAFDSDYRIEADRNMRRLMKERFPALPLGEADPKPRFVMPSFNNALTPAAFGCRVRFPENLYAQWEHENRYDALIDQDLSDVWSLYPYREIRRQTEYMNRKLATDEMPFLPPMGVMNGAVQLLGDKALGDLLEDNSPLPQLFDMLARHEMEKLRLNTQMGWRGAWYLFNCSVDMIGPMTYREKVLSFDARIAEYARSVNLGAHLHHCGCFDRFEQAYRGLGALCSLEVGFTTKATLAASYPLCTGPLYVILDHNTMRNGSRQDVIVHVHGIIDAVGKEKGRLTLLALDMDYGTPDENIEALLTCIN